jgi:DNA-binding protein HU-beta
VSEVLFLAGFPQLPLENPHKTRQKCLHDGVAEVRYETGSQKAAILKEEMMASGMTKTQTVKHMAEKTGTTNKTSAAFLENLADLAIKECKKNGIFVIPGLGRLVKVNRKARMGRNPQTGEAIKIPAKTVVKFRVAKACKDAVHSGKK